MRELSAAELLEAWERGSAQPPTERALTLIGAGCPELGADDLAGLSIGRRDAFLLTVRELAFGPKFAAVTDCPGCGERLELDFRVGDIRMSPAALEKSAPATISAGGCEVHFRLPDSGDLLAAATAGDSETARRVLLMRCLISARDEQGDLPPAQLPEDVVAKVEEEMLNLDSQANVRIELDCPACRQKGSAPFDIFGFFWGELDSWARRLLLEVHTLASAYGWREADILRMTAARRNIYIDMVGG